MLPRELSRVPKFPSTNVTSFHSVTLTAEAKPPGSKRRISLQKVKKELVNHNPLQELGTGKSLVLKPDKERT